MINFFNYIFKEDVTKMKDGELLTRLVFFSLKLFMVLCIVFIPLVMTSIVEVSINGRTYTGAIEVFYAILIIIIPCIPLPILLLGEIRFKSYE